MSVNYKTPAGLVRVAGNVSEEKILEANRKAEEALTKIGRAHV